MTPYSYLVLGVDPTSNEAGIPIKKVITVSFAKPINVSTLNENTIRLKKVNGDYVDYEGSYDYQNMKYMIKAKPSLEHGIQYQVIVMGGKDGIHSVDMGYLTATRTYEFTTISEGKKLPTLSNLELKQEHFFIHADWDLPSSLVLENAIRFHVKVSQSNNPEASAIWPKDSMEGVTTSTNFMIPFKAELEKQYYVHVQGRTENGDTNWVTSQIYMEPLDSQVPTNPDPAPTPDPGSGQPELKQLEIVDYGPKNEEIVTPHEFIAIFNEPLKIEDDMSELLYIVEAPPKEQLTLFDLRGRYSSGAAIGGEVSLDPEDNRILVFTINEGELKDDRAYTVVLSKDLTGVSGTKLGYTQVFGFSTEPTLFYGDIDHIRMSLNSYDVFPSNAFIQKLMKKYSQYVYQIWSTQSTFTATETPYYIHEYVNTQVMIDGFISSGVSSKIGGGGESFTLGDLSVTKNSGGQDDNGMSMALMVSQLRDQLKYWEDLIHGHNNRGYAKPGATVKGENVSAYPDYLTRSTLVDFGE